LTEKEGRGGAQKLLDILPYCRCLLVFAKETVWFKFPKSVISEGLSVWNIQVDRYREEWGVRALRYSGKPKTLFGVAIYTNTNRDGWFLGINHLYKIYDDKRNERWGKKKTTKIWGNVNRNGTFGPKEKKNEIQ